MKGLDGIQGPIYVGTGCVFKRHTLYGYDAPRKKKTPTKTCNCWPKWCCLNCCLRKKSKTINTKGSNTKVHDAEVSMADYALTCTEQGTRGTLNTFHSFDNILLTIFIIIRLKINKTNINFVNNMIRNRNLVKNTSI